MKDEIVTITIASEGKKIEFTIDSSPVGTATSLKFYPPEISEHEGSIRNEIGLKFAIDLGLAHKTEGPCNCADCQAAGIGVAPEDEVCNCEACVAFRSGEQKDVGYMSKGGEA